MKILFTRLSTGIKMLIILSTALLPLGLIALFASMDSARSSRLYREAQAQTLATDSARQIDARISETAATLHRAVEQGSTSAIACRQALDRMPAAQRQSLRFALFAPSGGRVCGDPGLSGRPARSFRSGRASELTLIPSPPALQIRVGAPGGAYGIAEIPTDVLGAWARLSHTGQAYGIILRDGTTRLNVRGLTRRSDPLDRQVLASATVAGGQATLELALRTAPITAIEMLMIVLPLLMWVAAAVIGWLVVERLLLSPLAQMQRAISSYRAGQGGLFIPKLTTPAHEIRELGASFRKVTDDLAQHEAELEQALARQTRLTREVHHRVKNNLQVVSSLINLHARGAPDGAVAAAYASIQRRVDALAIVHRNHFAEIEENRGVSLRALVGELAANLRGMAPPNAARMAITLNMIPAFATQDVAVPVAFLLTEIVELTTECAPGSPVAILLQPGERDDRALLTIEAPGLDEQACLGHVSMDRFRRIVQGLARQLRSTLHHEEGSGRYEIQIAVVPELDSPA